MRFQFIQKKLTLTTNIASSVPRLITSDAKRIKQVLFNLMGNAVKFTYYGGVTLTIDFSKETKTLTASVKDTGLGMAPDDLQRLFRFFGCLAKTKDINRGGIGLGLTISKMILQKMGGDIHVESKPGVGSKFTFIIPIEVLENQPSNDLIVEEEEEKKQEDEEEKQ